MADKITLTKDQLDDLLHAQERMIRRGIDASACGTDRDWRRFHEAETAYYDLRDRLGL